MSRQNSYRRTVNKAYFNELGYRRLYHADFDYSELSHIMQRRQRGKGTKKRYNDVIIMADTETSKAVPDTVCINHVCLWTISLRAYHANIVTLWGTKPSDMVECMDQIHAAMEGERTLIFFHNMAYDFQFLRKFMFKKWGFPTSQLNTKPHYQVSIEFECGIVFRDSLIIAQRSLERWGHDLEADHRKAVGLWDYDIIRNQDYVYSEDELTYAENDTLVGVECLDLFMLALKCDLTTIPFTATGIVRKESRQVGGKGAHKQFLRKCIRDYELLEMCFRIYHGGYTHANRYLIGEVITGLTECYDFASSYPYHMIARCYPAEAYRKCDGIYSPEDVIQLYAENKSVLFTLKMSYVKLVDGRHPMPLLQMSKAKEVINPIVDNGRILQCDYIEIDLNEVDFNLIYQQYKYDLIQIENVYIAKKDWMPRWFTNFIYEKYKDKCQLKGQGVLYDISKMRVNCLYGMCCQRPIRETIEEDYETGEFYLENPEGDMQGLLDKYNKKFGSILPYQWGLYVTSYAQESLFRLGSCCRKWIYSDTDSVYGQLWDKEKLNAYNEECKQIMLDRGYGPVHVGDKVYHLGVAELDKSCLEFKTLGSKRYALRKTSGELVLTVAGVPKYTGVLCLDDDINNFREGMVFEGSKTKKKTHTFFYSDDIFIDDQGNEVGDCIDLSPCDYTLDSTELFQWIFSGHIGEYDIECFDGGVIT